MDSKETHDNSSSFIEVIGDGSTKYSEIASSNKTTIGSERPESVTTTVRSYHKKGNKEVPEEFCSRCFKEEIIKAASHFCKECKSFGQYLCHTCLKEHNKWTCHKQIFSLSQSQLQRRNINKTGNNENDLKQTNYNEEKVKRVNDWVHYSSPAHCGIHAQRIRTFKEDDEDVYNTVSSSTTYTRMNSHDSNTIQTPSVDYSTIRSIGPPGSKPTTIDKNDNTRSNSLELSNSPGDMAALNSTNVPERQWNNDITLKDRYNKLISIKNRKADEAIYDGGYAKLDRYDIHEDIKGKPTVPTRHRMPWHLSSPRLQQVYRDTNQHERGGDDSEILYEEIGPRMHQHLRLYRSGDIFDEKYQFNPLYRDERFARESKKKKGRCSLM